MPRQAALYRATVIREVRFYWGMAEKPSTFLGQIHQESTFREDAKSPVGATGLAQMMPGTSRWLMEIYPRDLKELCPDKSGCPLSPAWAIRSLVLFDKRLYDDFRWANGAIERWSATLSGYNGGRSWVLRERRACAGTVGCNDTLWFGNIELACLRSATSCKENRNYPRRILLELRHHYE